MSTGASTSATEIEAHVRWVRRLARSLVGDADCAEDLAQDTLAAALEHPPAGGRVTRGWLATVLRNFVRQFHRSEARRRERERRSARRESAPSTAEMLERIAAQRMLVEAIQTLEEPYRETLLLRYLENMPPREIARHQHVPIGTVKTRLARAIQRLRQRLDRRFGGVRDSWVTALAPLAHAPAGNALAAAGPLLMTMKAKLAVAALLLLGAVSVFWDAGRSEAPAALQSSSAVYPAKAGGLPAPSPASVPEAGRVEIPAPGPEGTAQAIPGRRGFRRLQGRVLDLEGRPVPDARVVAGRRDRSNQQSSDPAASALSDELGWFTLEHGLTAGAIWVEQEGLVTLLAGQIRPRESAGPSIVVVAPAFALNGRVTDPEGAPLAGARVDLLLSRDFEARIGENLEDSYRLEWKRETGPDGRFAVARAPAVEALAARIRLMGYKPAVAQVQRDTRRPWEVVLQPVANDALLLRGQIFDEGGRFVGGAYVALGRTTVRSDPQGLFALSMELAVEKDLLKVVRQGLQPAVLGAPGDPGSERAGWPDFVTIRMTGRALSITGRVVDSEGGPLSGHLVWCTDPEVFGRVGDEIALVEGLMRGEGPARSGASTGADGRFRIEGLQNRTYNLRAMDPRTLLAADSGRVRAGSEDVLIVLQTDALHPVFSGRVVTRTGEPVPDARVVTMRRKQVTSLGNLTTVSMHTGQYTTTGGDGWFRFTDLPKEDVTLVVEGDSIMRTTYELSGDEPSEGLKIVASVRCRLQLQLPGRLADATGFAVLDGTGAELELWIVRGYSTDAVRLREVRAGRSQVVRVSEEASVLVLYRDGEELTRIPLSLRPGELNVVGP